MQKGASVLLVGGGGHAVVVYDLVDSVGGRVEGFFDRSAAPPLSRLSRHLGDYDASIGVGASVLIAIGENRMRKHLAESVRHPFPAAVIHPDASVSRFAEFGNGTVVLRGALVQPLAQIGSHVIVNTGASIDHECQIGDFAQIAPGATLCGNVRVNTGAMVCAGATIRPGIIIGEWSLVGAGAVVTKDVPPGIRVAGVPARPMDES